MYNEPKREIEFPPLKRRNRQGKKEKRYMQISMSTKPVSNHYLKLVKSSSISKDAASHMHARTFLM